MEKVHRLYETDDKIHDKKDFSDEIHTKNSYLESYSRRQNINFINIEYSTEIGGSAEDIEEVLRTFLERDLGYRETRNAEFQCVYRIGNSKDENPRPILVQSLTNKNCQQIFSLDDRSKGTSFQMF